MRNHLALACEVTDPRPLQSAQSWLMVARMSVQVSLPDDLAEQIDHVATDRTAFVTEAVRRLLRDSSEVVTDDEVARINEVADELNREAEDVLEYQAIS